MKQIDEEPRIAAVRNDDPSKTLVEAIKGLVQKLLLELGKFSTHKTAPPLQKPKQISERAVFIKICVSSKQNALISNRFYKVKRKWGYLIVYPLSIVCKMLKEIRDTKRIANTASQF